MIALYPTQQNWKCLHIRNCHYTLFQISNVWSRRSLGRKSRFFSPLGFDVQTNSDHETQKIKLYSVRALKRCLDEKSIIHGRVMATISNFSPQIFETDFSSMYPKFALTNMQLRKKTTYQRNLHQSSVDFNIRKQTHKVID